jgi:hypothetical protein
MSKSISTGSIRSLLALAEKRDALLAEIEVINAEFSKILDGNNPEKTAPISSGRRGRKAATVKTHKLARGKRGSVKEVILAGLKEAGDAGIAVKHLAAKLGIKPQNIHVWLHTTGKKNGLVEALGNGVYRLEEAMRVNTPGDSLSAPKPIAYRKRVKRKAK